MARSLIVSHPTHAEAARRIAFADAALAVADHEVTDLTLRTLMNRVARGELSGDAAVTAMRRHVQG